MKVEAVPIQDKVSGSRSLPTKGPIIAPSLLCSGVSSECIKMRRIILAMIKHQEWCEMR